MGIKELNSWVDIDSARLPSNRVLHTENWDRHRKREGYFGCILFTDNGGIEIVFSSGDEVYLMPLIKGDMVSLS